MILLSGLHETDRCSAWTLYLKALKRDALEREREREREGERERGREGERERGREGERGRREAKQ